jgi:hypothetical protein
MSRSTSTARSDTAPLRPSAGRRGGYVVGALVNGLMLYLINVRPGWDAVPFLTPDTVRVLDWVNASIIAGLVTNLLFVGYDAPRWRALGGMVTTAVGMAALVRLLQIHPFDLDQPWTTVVRALLIVGIVGSAIGFVVNLVSFFAAVLRGR